MFPTTRHPTPPPATAAAAALQSLLGDEARLARAGATALAALLVARHLDGPVDVARTLEMALARALTADARDRLDPDDALHLRALDLELATAGTSEAKLVHALAALLDGKGYGGRDRFLARLGRALAAAGDRRAAG